MQIWQSLKWHFYFHHAKKKKKTGQTVFDLLRYIMVKTCLHILQKWIHSLILFPFSFALFCFFFYEEELMRTLWIVAEVAPPVSFRLALSVLNNCLSIYAAAANSKSWSVIGPCNIISWPRSATAYNISRLCVLTVDGKKVTKSNETEIILTDRIST